MGIKNAWIIIAAATTILFLVFSSVTNAQKEMNTLNKTVAELTGKSGLIVVGKVSRIHSEWDKGKSRIYTKVTVNVEEFVKGNEPGKNIVVTHLGGEVGSVGELYSGTPKFKADEEVMLFLHKSKKGNLRVTRGSLGKFNVHRDKTTNMRILDNGVSIDNIKAIVKGNLKK
jgi:hypothetical protein